MKTGTINAITGWILFAIIFVVYLMTVAPTISFWDSAEFITCAFTMGIPHPPGSPLLSLIGRVMSILPFYDFRGSGFEHIAYRINLINVITGALTVMLTYFIVVKLLTRIKPFRGTFRHDWPILFSAVVAAFLAAFSHQFWENSIETETYMPSLFLSMLAVWLTLRWVERKSSPDAVRYLFLAAYLIGLGNGVHLYVLLIVPTVLLIVIAAKSSWFADAGLWLGLVVIMISIACIRFLGGKNIFYLVMMIMALAGPLLLSWFYRSGARQWKLILTGMLVCLSLYVIGYSVYPTIMVRASKNPSINEGDPDTWTRYREYLERKQFGQGNMYTGMFTRKAEAGYQFGFMYLRYLLQQFPKWGPSPRATFMNNLSADYPGRTVSVREEVYIPVLLWALILFGIYMHVRRDTRFFGAFLLYFLASSIGLVLYLNMENPQVRERDYFFLGSFHIVMIWVGFGIYGVLALVQDVLAKRNLVRITTPVIIILAGAFATLVPGAVLSRHIDPDYNGYQIHDRSRNFIPLEYGLNIINFCEPDAILFTNGDNDTFPLWYIQEVMGIRRDVRVVNLSLLKAPWYIKQLRDEGKTIPITLSDSFIDNNLCSDSIESQKTLLWDFEPRLVTMAGLTWEMPPTYQYTLEDGRKIGFLSPASFTTAHIIKTVDWTRPIYFAVTVNPLVLIGLDKFMSSEGMVFRLVKEKAAGRYNINAPVLDRNIFTQYLYNGVSDPTVYKSTETINLLRNYFIAFVDLYERYLELGDRVNALRAAHGALELTNPELDRRIMLYSMLNENGFDSEVEQMIETEIELLPLDDLESSSAVGSRFLLYSLDQASVRIFKTLIEHHPRGDMAWKGYAASLYRSERYSEALAALDTLLTIVPGDNEAMQLRKLILDNLKQ